MPRRSVRRRYSSTTSMPTERDPRRTSTRPIHLNQRPPRYPVHAIAFHTVAITVWYKSHLRPVSTEPDELRFEIVMLAIHLDAHQLPSSQGRQIAITGRKSPSNIRFKIIFSGIPMKMGPHHCGKHAHPRLSHGINTYILAASFTLSIPTSAPPVEGTPSVHI